MKNKVCCSIEFQKIFAGWIHDHMYPPNYRKEKAMKKPAHRHIDAITRAHHLLETGIDVNEKPKLAKSIQDDINLLCEVRDMLYEIMENPSLPFVDAYDDDEKPVLGRIENEPNGAF